MLMMKIINKKCGLSIKVIFVVNVLLAMLTFCVVSIVANYAAEALWPNAGWIPARMQTLSQQYAYVCLALI
jgi:hypothetical protein